MIFVSHCLLNEHTCYLVGAFLPGDLDELMDGFQREGMGISQMTYPEQRTCCREFKNARLPMYGLRGILLYGSVAPTTYGHSSRGTHDGGTEEPLGEAQRRSLKKSYQEPLAYKEGYDGLHASSPPSTRCARPCAAKPAPCSASQA